MRLAALIVAILAAALFSAHDASGQWAMRLRISPGYGIQVTPSGVNQEGEQVVSIGISDLIVPTILPADSGGTVACAAPYQFRFTSDKGGIEICDGIGGKRRVLRFDGGPGVEPVVGGACAAGAVAISAGELVGCLGGRWARMGISAR